MARKAVSFAEASCQAEFQTWPRPSIKQYCHSVPFKTVDTDMASVVSDLYYRFQQLQHIDVDKCVEYIVNGRCENALVGYSVLNTILKSGCAPDQEDETSSPAKLTLNAEYSVTLLERACHDFKKFSSSRNVLESRTLQQIMRVVEGLWAKNCISGHNSGEKLREFAAECIDIIETRPGSKLLLSPAVRVTNQALDDGILTAGQIENLVNALSRTQFAFAASFSAEAMLVLTTIQRVVPEVLTKTAGTWVPLAVRALVSASSLTRTLALHLLDFQRSTPFTADALMDPCDPLKPDSEPLYKLVLRKFGTLLASNSADDIKIVVESWCLVLESAAYISTENEWELLEYWLEIERMVFKLAPKTVSFAWNSLISVQKQHISYTKALLVPFIALSSTELPMARMLGEAVTAVDASNPLIWSQFFYPLFRTVGQRKDKDSGTLLSVWAGPAADNMQFVDGEVPQYLEILSLAMKQQHNSISASTTAVNCEKLWTKIARCCTKSRSRAMEVVRFHYHLLSQDNTASSMPHLQLTNVLMRVWPFQFLTERSKPGSFSLLTLVLLPVVIFVPGDKQGEYIDRLLANCKSEVALRSMLLALLYTVDAGSDHQLQKWATASTTIREYMGNTKEATPVVVEALLSFLPLVKDASASHWSLWASLFTLNTSNRDRVLSKLDMNNVPPLGLKTIITLPLSNSEKTRLAVASLINGTSPNNAFTILKQANLSTDIVDKIARELVSQKRVDTTRWALELVTGSRVFVVAKPLLAVIGETLNTELVDLWNSTVAPAIDNRCPPFVSKLSAAKLQNLLPQLEVPVSIIIPPTMSNSPSPKRTITETPPPSNKRPRRGILTGSVPPSSLGASLLTPPVSSDPPEEAGINDDMLCSSPPQRMKSSQKDRARTLKRVMMGLDMDEAVQDMKRSEQEMIYNLMFRSCVKLRTHLAATAPTLPHIEVAEAQDKLQSTILQREKLEAAENIMIENGKRRLQEGAMQSASDEDSDVDDDDDEYIDSRAIKLEV